MTDHHQKPRGILRNKDEVQIIPHEISDQLDRQEVIKNTQLNARLSSEYSRGEKIRAKIAEEKRRRSFGASSASEGETEEDQSGDHLKWDEINLYKTEQEKAATMKIDEPKTPYEGGFNPQGEYYRDDDEAQDDIPSFELGAGEFDKEHAIVGSLRGGQVVPNDENEQVVEDEPEEEHELTAEERHRIFEEKRKQHYHLKGMVLKQKFAVSDEDLDDEDEDINTEEKEGDE